MVVVDGEPSDSHHPTPDREGNPQHSSHGCHPGGSTPHQLQVNLGNLADDELQQLMEDVMWDVTLRQLNAPPDSPLTPCRNPVGNRDPDVDDWEFTFLRGRVETQRTTTSCPCSHTTRGRVGTQRTASSPPQHLLNPMMMWHTLSTHWPSDCNLVPLI